MNEFVNMIVNRRTIRKYKPEQISDEILNNILEAGLYAPNAGGRQSPLIVVSQDAELNHKLGQKNLSAFRKTTGGKISETHQSSSYEQPSIADDASIPSAFYGAPTVITIFAPKDIYNFTGDCFMAAANMMLAAHALGVGSCMVARPEATFAGDEGQALLKSWNIDENYEARIHITMGYPDGETPKAKPRRDDRVIRV